MINRQNIKSIKSFIIYNNVFSIQIFLLEFLEEYKNIQI